MKLVVQKFGGSSVADKDGRDRVLSRIIQAKQEGFSPIVVVSAIGRKGDPYATDTLLQFAAQAGPDTPKREIDMLMACGEIISCTLLSALLEQQGYRAQAYTGGQAGIITNSRFGNAEITEMYPEKILDAAKTGIIPVVAGFQGQTSEGDITTLGRGGSDITAIALGIAVEALSVDIFTDVSGIMTADPRVVSSARMLDVVSYEEAIQLAYHGTKVVHPRALELAKQHNFKLRVRSTFDEGLGTVIVGNDSACRGSAGKQQHSITGISHMVNLAQLELINVDPLGLEQLSTSLISMGIDFEVPVSSSRVLMIVNESSLHETMGILAQNGVEAEISGEMAKVSLIGMDIANDQNLLGSTRITLRHNNIVALHTVKTDYALSFILKQEDMESMILALHDALILGI